MRCTRLIDLAEGLLAGGLDDEDRRDAGEHLAGCPSCRALIATLGGDPAERSIPPPAGLAAAILERTSGPVCESARERLCDWVDGTLRTPDLELVQQHLEACSGCAALAGAMARMSAELPALAEIAPRPGFAEAVLATTSGAKAGWATRVARFWRSAIARPRFALEGAYAGAMAAVLVFGVTPLARAPRAAADLLEIREPAARLETRFRADVRSLWEEAVARASLLTRDAAARAGDLGSAVMEQAEGRLGTIRRALASEGGNNDVGREAEHADQEPADGGDDERHAR